MLLLIKNLLFDALSKQVLDMWMVLLLFAHFFHSFCVTKVLIPRYHYGFSSDVSMLLFFYNFVIFYVFITTVALKLLSLLTKMVEFIVFLQGVEDKLLYWSFL